MVQLQKFWPLLPLATLMSLSPIVALIGQVAADSCTINTQNQYPKQAHYFFYKDQDLPIILEDSNRISHRITNMILKIILENFAGYANVKIEHCYFYDNHNITILLDRISGKMASKHCQPPTVNYDTIPNTMVNLEAWMVAGFDKGPWLDTHLLVDAGPLGPQGRMGWFIPTAVVDEVWKNDSKIIDHWISFSVPKLAGMFSWWGKKELEELQPDYRVEAFRNPRCHDIKGKRPKCATLFASNKGVDAGVLESQILALNLSVDIVWLEDKLHTFINEQVLANQRVLFFSSQPDTLIASGKFTRVNFPETHSSHKNDPRDCDFPVNQLTKVLWGPLKTGAPEAYHIISKMTFSDIEYDQLISLYPDKSVNEIACWWVQNNMAQWDKWLPSSLKEKPKIYLGGLFPLSGRMWSQPGIVAGAKLAVDLVNKDPKTLPNHTLMLLEYDTKCEDDVAMSQFISLAQQRNPPIAGILGTGCSDPAERIAALSKHFNIMMVSYGAEAQSLSDREKYPYFFRTVPPVQLYTHVFPNLFKELGWRTVGALAEGGQEFPEYHMTLQGKLKLHGISLIVRRKSLNGTHSSDIAQILKEFKAQNVRVIIADVFSHVAREIMCEAYKQKMTAFEGYVWFLPSWYQKDWQNVDYYNSEPDTHEAYPHRENVPCSTAEVEHGAEGHFVLSKSFTAPLDTWVVGNITVREFKALYAKRLGTFVEESNFASFAYDAVWVYAKGLHALLKQNHGALETIHSVKTARAFRSAIANLSFSGVSGWIKFDGSDRNADLIILQEFSNDTRVVGHYSPIKERKGEPILKIYTNLIRWLSPQSPVKDKQENPMEECLFETFRAQLGVTCTIANVIITVFVFFGFVIIAIIIPIVMKYRCDAARMKKFKATHERIKELGLLKEEFSPILTVDGWEIPRKDVVLNRVLGEGAFGTVMGGEMHKEKEGWVAVAVKTLKLDHKVEEKLDFFREVDMMKSFKHENIVQLWGVCTRKEPMYAVMEFLLHGDLKTYLLSRRNLVGQGVKEAEEVKAENLTQMAVDVAKGLDFLHSLKYVHRDIACRNCLVHANKTVKISDFGMTRHISSTDYYRFSRKAMLPVRWTAPEALKDGIYSAKSDIWSFGVLVFEIVTFGSFPYQGLSNKEVLDYVGKGNLLMLPEKCPPELKSFIRWCLSYDPGYRPDLLDIISFLNFSPAFLTPCLDAPTTSIVHEDTDSLEMPAGQGVSSASHHSSAPQPSIDHQAWQEKLKEKKKTFSGPGLSSLGKSGKSTVSTRSPVSSSRSSSVCSGMLQGSSICGLNTCSITNGMTANGDERDDCARSENLNYNYVKTEMFRHSLRSQRKDGIADTDIETSKIEHRKSVHSDHRRFSLNASSDKGDISSGYISQNSKGESKQICQTVTSL